MLRATALQKTLILTFVFFVASVMFLLPTTSNVDLQKESKEEYIDWMNCHVREFFGRNSFSDSRMDVVNFTILPPRTVCEDVDFLVVVHVRASDMNRRQRWRLTYGAERLRNEFRYRILFSVGTVNETSAQSELAKEAAEYYDILQADYIDAYRNLTFKNLAEFRYLCSVCPEKFEIVRMDDDVTWNVQKLSAFVRSKASNSGLHCEVIKNSKPFWEPGVK